MATESAKGKRRLEAIRRIEAACSELNGGQPLLLPTYSRHGLDILLILQLETIAAFLENAIGEAVPMVEWTPPQGTEFTTASTPDEWVEATVIQATEGHTLTPAENAVPASKPKTPGKKRPVKKPSKPTKGY